MSKAAIDPNAVMMGGAERRRARKEAEVDARVAAAAERLGPKRIKKVVEAKPEETAVAVEEASMSHETVEAEAKHVEPTSPSKGKKSTRQTTVEIEVETYRQVEMILFEHKMKGERMTFKEFLNNALRMAVDKERGIR